MTIDELTNTEQKVMSQLKDFQRATVERVDYLFRNKQNRVLVADEVGLGKTLIAKGVIAKTAKLRYEEGDNLFKVVYVCSNQNIARQNIQKLNVFNYGIDNYSGYRLSMQFYAIEKRDRELGNNGQFVQLLTLTPETSFNQRGGQGTIDERAMITAVLTQIFENEFAYSDIRTKAIDRLKQIMNNRGFDTWFYKYTQWHSEIWRIFPWKSDIHRTLLADNVFFDKVLDYLLNGNGFKSDGAFIGFVRQQFAFVSVKMLNPDLVILDEFQRFKYLIDNTNDDSESAMLARSFLTPIDNNSVQNTIRVLLLSATPYKLFSTLDELGDGNDDDHFKEFHAVVKFLFDDNNKYAEFQNVWSNYSLSLKELKNDNLSILNLQQNVHLAEKNLYGCMCRTERISVMDSTDYIDDSSKNKVLEINENDINSYRDAIALINKTEITPKFTTDFIKSSPFILSFMQKYELKQKLIHFYKSNPNKLPVIHSNLLWLSKKIITNYEKLPATNARLTRLFEEVFKSQSYAVNNPALFLWVPPSMPYYEFGGVYRGSEGFSKLLVFSAWEMVPRMISCLVSYEEERLTIGSGRLDNYSKYFEANRTPENRIDTASQFYLTYPCKTFAEMFKPQNGSIQRLDTLLNSLKKKIEKELELLCDTFKIEKIDKGHQDKKWFSYVPILLDYIHYGVLPEDYDLLIDVRSNNIKLGKQPTELVDILCYMILGSPAVCLYRANPDPTWAKEIAKDFVSYFNSQAKTAIVELANNTRKLDDNNHWQNVLMYCTNGNFQAMIDEYIHLLKDTNSDWTIIREAFSEALGLYTTTLSVDFYGDFCQSIKGQGKSYKGMRSHYAVGFVSGKSNEKVVNRKESIRNTFNSPFWPFVLASTSIGQEGLDFHLYCRKIMHWNLPCNPIDLEQREGRINRFKCLAIRQNLAQKYSTTVDFSSDKDPWEQMFESAHNEKPSGTSDLIPYWCFGKDQNVKIERLLACYPFSRDESSYERLTKILSLYRLTLGQPRQEELLEYVFKEFGDGEKLKDLFINLSPFSKTS